LLDRKTFRSAVMSIVLLTAVACSGEASSSESSEGAAVSANSRPIAMRVRVLAEYPHDPRAYTQGLVWHEGRLYEGTGQYEESTLRRIDYERGIVEQSVDLPSDHFGEGIAIVGEHIIQLTWHAGVAHVWTLEGFEPVESRRYSGEGWGLTFDGTDLYMTDGTHIVTRRDPESFEVLERIRVTRGSNPLDKLNELEWVDGKIWANVYETDRIVAIDPQSGRVVVEVDASGLLDEAARSRAEVLNGIAYRPDTGTFLITGKDWPTLFEVVFEEAGAAP
jgi:glutamine cyclotransferase